MTPDRCLHKPPPSLVEGVCVGGVSDHKTSNAIQRRVIHRVWKEIVCVEKWMTCELVADQSSPVEPNIVSDDNWAALAVDHWELLYYGELPEL